MTNQEIRSTLHEFIVKQFPGARKHDLDGAGSLIAHGVIDSLGVLEMVIFIEQQFGITFGDDDLVSEHFDSLPALTELIAGKLRASQACSS